MSDGKDVAEAAPEPGRQGIASRLRGLSPLSPHPSAATTRTTTTTVPAPPEPELPRAHTLSEPISGPRWRRFLGWFGLPVLGIGAVVVPRLAQPATVQVQVATPRSDPNSGAEKGANHALAFLEQLDERIRDSSRDKRQDDLFQQVLSKVAEQAADRAVDALLVIAATGVWRAAEEIHRRRLARRALFLGNSSAEAPADHDEDNFRQIAGAVAEQDHWLITAAKNTGPEPPPTATKLSSEVDLLAAGRRFVTAMGNRLRPVVCADKGLVRKSVEDTTKEIGGQARKALFQGDLTSGVALAISGVAAAIAKVGLEKFCRKQEDGWME